MKKLSDEIFSAFSSRERPSAVLNDSMVGAESEDYDDAAFFTGKTNREIRSEDLENHPDCVFGFSPQAFLYYLPSIFSCAVEDDRPDLLVIHSLVSMLDRSNRPSTWDNFFSSRWPCLNNMECEATLKWLVWLSRFSNLSIENNSLTRAFDTITLIQEQALAYPIAKHQV